MLQGLIQRTTASTLRATNRLLHGSPDAFLRKVSGVIHVGANTGQERELYAKYNLDVIWIEPIPEVFSELKANLKGFPRQHAYQYLLTDKDDEEYLFNVASNAGGSSSILEFNLHQDFWPDIHYERQIKLESITLKSLVKKEGIEIDNYDALIMDTQGSEMLVLKGAESLLSRFTYIKSEVPDFESYKNCCRIEDLARFLGDRGFREINRNKIAVRKTGGTYYDIVYR